MVNDIQRQRWRLLKLLCELFHEDNVDGVLYHQDAVILKGCPTDDSRNYVGSLLLVQQRPVGSKRFLKGVALPQPNYLVWLPYSFLYCMGSHLLSGPARKSIDAEQNLTQLTFFTARLREAMMEADYSNGVGAADTTATSNFASPTRLQQQQQQQSNTSFGSPSSSSAASSSSALSPATIALIDESLQRLDWDYTICHPIGQIHKMIRKSNIRGRRILTMVKKETLAMDAPIIFEEGGMSKLFDELKKICQVDVRAGDEVYLSREQITSSVPYEDHHHHHGNHDDDELSSNNSRSNGRGRKDSQGNGLVARVNKVLGGGGGGGNDEGNNSNSGNYNNNNTGGNAVNNTNNSNNGTASVPLSSGANESAGLSHNVSSDSSQFDAFQPIDPALVHDTLYGPTSGGFKSKATIANEMGNQQGGKDSKGGIFGNILAFGATFARSAKTATSAFGEDYTSPNNNNNNTNTYGGADGGAVGRTTSSIRAAAAGGLPPSTRSRTDSKNTSNSARDRTENSESEFDFADDVSSSSSPLGTRKSGGGSAENNNQYIHGDGSLRRHQEPLPPVLTMPLSSRKLAPPLGRLDWKNAFDNNVNTMRLTKVSSLTNVDSMATLPPSNSGGVSSSSAGAAAPSSASSAGSPAPSSLSGVGAASNPNIIGREFAYGGNGSLRDDETFRKLRIRAFNGTISDDVRPQAWAYMLGVFPVGSTPQERKAILDDHEREYAILSQQWRSIFPAQEARFGDFREHRVAIEKDVMRTDRTHPDFRDDGSVKLSQLRNVLMAYAMYNFDLGYCQGMSDVLAILLLVYPDDEVMCYTVFKHLLANKIEGNFRHEMKRNMEVHLREVQLLIKKFSPDLYGHLTAVGAEAMTFTFRWLLILFKREFDIKSVMKLWDVVFASPFTPHFEAIIAAAILDNVGHQIIEQDLAYDEILKFANSMTGQFDVNDVIMLSHDFYNSIWQQLAPLMSKGAGGGQVGGAVGSGGNSNSVNAGVDMMSGGDVPVFGGYSGVSAGGSRARGGSLSSPLDGPSGGGGGESNSTNSSKQTTTSSSTNNRATLPDIIAFLEVEIKEKAAAEAKKKASGGNTRNNHLDPF